MRIGELPIAAATCLGRQGLPARNFHREDFGKSVCAASLAFENVLLLLHVIVQPAGLPLDPTNMLFFGTLQTVPHSAALLQWQIPWPFEDCQFSISI